jgi:hypothetical protein
MIKNENYAHGKQPLPKFISCQRWADSEEDHVLGEIVEGTQQVFYKCNFAATIPHTAIGADGVIFRECNLHNCDIAAGSVLEDCSQVGNFISWCSHENNFKDLPECAEDCEHSEEHIVIEDSVEIGRFYTYVEMLEVV